MTFNQSEDETQTSEEMPNAYANEVDRLLALLVSCADEAGIEIGITLNVNGLMISGNIVSRTTFLEGTAQAIARGGSPSNTRSGLQDIFTNAAEESRHIIESSGVVGTTPLFIHLKNAIFFPSKTSISSAQGYWWRGRLTSVDGFFLGALPPLD
jgi:hypothetical protein